jgi:hypothetical protein
VKSANYGSTRRRFRLVKAQAPKDMAMSMRAILTFVATLLAISSAAFAQLPNSAALDNWPQWRGPLSSGVAPHGDPPTEWSETKNVKWKIKVPGDSTATPIIWGDKIFLTTAVETEKEGEPEPPPEEFAATSKQPDGSKRGFRTSGKAPTHVHEFVVLCLDRASGKTLWQQTAKEAVPHEGHHPDGSFAAASPSTDGQRLYVSFGSRGVYCYDLAGKQLWHRDLGRMSTNNVIGEVASPL